MWSLCSWVTAIAFISAISPPAEIRASLIVYIDAPATISIPPFLVPIYVLFPEEPLKSGQILDIFNLFQNNSFKKLWEGTETLPLKLIIPWFQTPIMRFL